MAVSRMRFVIITFLLAVCTAPDVASADQAEAWAALREGRHVALMRHADAPGGAGDPPGFRIDDCATQRNLSSKGRADAARIGARLRSEGIAVEKILSSPWCRCMDTATLLALGPIEVEPTFGNVVVLSDQTAALTAGGRAIIDKWTGSGILLVVTHGANIRALTGISPASGEIVVVRGGSGGGKPVGRLTFD
nr:histidine phosphatase family protein [Bradyrhizobium sp. BRP22]